MVGSEARSSTNFAHGAVAVEADYWDDLVRILHWDGQPDAAEEPASRASSPLPEKGQEFKLRQCHRSLCEVYRSKRETGEALDHLEIALRIASAFNCHCSQLSWIYRS